MRRLPCLAVMFAALLAPQQAAAFMLVPDEAGHGRYVVVIETASGDHVPLDLLPPGFRQLGGPAWAGEGLTFRWRYFRSPEQGRAVVVFDEDDRAVMEFAFSGDELADGDTIAAAAALVDGEGRAITTIYASARVKGRHFENGETASTLHAPIGIAPDGWDEVAGFTFFTMKYYAIQNLDEAGVAVAMRRAVHRVTAGTGTEEWARPRD
ncbi:hypothetical protein FY036_17485 [Mesorhizobium microcysteis]|uniref:Uncharacterized protein n=1 Tax=Neoaquamicrobium microcysteis TaxID=2682781 RepID=A0A5D4GQA2_9HYPH|nr:hypothetical protein [Mesorhizobium microcysteis]TYR30508.1 hypothetical protein FY036_17485 [Mesorhizobium microcysteis]